MTITPDNMKKINAFLSEKTGVWEEIPARVLRHGNQGGCGKVPTRKAPLDFFTPDGMVRLMEWLRKNGGYARVHSNKTRSDYTAVASWKHGRNILADADTPQRALAQAAFKALGGKEI